MTKRNCLVFFLITALIFTMCSVSVLAEEGETAPDSTVQTETTDTPVLSTTADDSVASDDSASEEPVSNDTAASDSDKAEDTAAADDKSESDDTASDSEGATGTEESGKEDEEHDHEHEEEGTKKKGLSTTAIVLLAVFGAIILIFAVLYIFKPKFRERVKKFFREYKSELKKVVWSSKADVFKNTKIVIIGIIAIAVVVGLVDIGLGALIDLIGKIGK